MTPISQQRNFLVQFSMVRINNILNYSIEMI